MPKRRPLQRYFDQGLRLAWGFNHAEARAAEQHLVRTWSGERKYLDLARL